MTMSRECVAAGILLAGHDPDGEIPANVHTLAGARLGDAKVIAAKFRQAIDDPFFVLEWRSELFDQCIQDPEAYGAYQDLIHVLGVLWKASEAGREGRGPEVLGPLIEEAAGRFLPGVTVTVSPVTVPDAEPPRRC
jgi:hypothetical protein